MKVIELLNRKANGEEIPKKIRIDHWCYEFEWDETAGNYIDKKQDIDLMSCLSMDEEELNYEIHELKEDKKIEKLKIEYSPDIEEWIFYENGDNPNHCILGDAGTKLLINKINEIIDYINKEK